MRKEALGIAAAAAGLGWLIGWSARRSHDPPTLPARASTDGRSRIVILGGGWGGVYTALTLEKLLRPGEAIEVVLINRENFFLFTPMLPDATGAEVNVSHIVNPIRRLLRRTRFVMGEVESINLQGRQIAVRLPAAGVYQFNFDHLVLALGGETNFYGMESVRQGALTVKSLADAIAIRNHLIHSLEEADVTPLELREALLTFALAGGGLNGVEVMGAINDFLREAVKSYPHIASGEIRTILLEAGPRLMPEVDPSLATFTKRKLEERGVEVWLNSRVGHMDERAVHLADGRNVATRTLIWSAGVRPSSLLATLPFDRDRTGRVIVDRYLRVPGQEGVWALGDCAHVPNPKAGKDAAFPMTAQHALREAFRLGRNLAATVRGEDMQPFSYPLHIQLATLGHHVGVASIMGVNISGFLPWWLWRTYYLARLPRLDRRLRVTLDWTLDLFFPRDIVQLPVRTGRGATLPTLAPSGSPERKL